MPKLFTVLLNIEEVALGHVMNMLHKTPGVARVDLVMGDTPSAKTHAKENGHANGHAAKPAKAPFKGEFTGEQSLIRLLKKKPARAAQIQTAFKHEGRSPDSYASVVWQAKKDGLVQQKEERGEYSLTKKGRDKARFI